MSSNKSDDELNQETLMFVSNLINGRVNPLPSVENQPKATLIRWQVARVSDGDRLVGYHVEGHEGRVSMPVLHFDPKTCRCMTKSGRRYQLMGVPGFDRDGNYVFSLAYRRGDSKDVTDEYWSAVEKARREPS